MAAHPISPRTEARTARRMDDCCRCVDPAVSGRHDRPARSSHHYGASLSAYHLAALGKKAVELVALAQAARTFLPVARHLAEDTQDGPRPHVEPPVELLDASEDVLTA